MSILDSLAGYVGAEKAEDAQYAASQAALAAQKKGMNEVRSNLNPYTQIGMDSTALISRLFGLGGQPADMSAFTASPGYQFRLQQGEDAIGRSAAAQGGLFSGAAGKALNDYAQNSASEEFNNYLNRLFGLSGAGQTAATNLSNLRMGNAGNIANIQSQIGTNQANRIMNQSNAIGSGLSDATGLSMYDAAKQGVASGGSGSAGLLAMLGL